MSRVYRSYDEFKREELSGATRVGFRLEDIEIDEWSQDFLFDDVEDGDDDE